MSRWHHWSGRKGYLHGLSYALSPSILHAPFDPNPKSNPWAGMDDMFCVHHLRYNCYHLTGMKEEPKSLPNRDSFFKQAPSKGEYRTKFWKSTKIVQIYWNKKQKEKPKKETCPCEIFKRKNTARLLIQTHDIIDIRVTRQVARENLCVLFTFLLLMWSTNSKFQPIIMQGFRYNKKFRVKLR